MAHVAFGNDMAFLVVRRDSIRAVPCAVLAPDTAWIVVKNDAVVKFDVAVGRTSDEAGGIDTVVTTHGVKQQKSIWEASPLHFTYTSPFDVGRVIILLIARYFTAAASDTFGGIKMESVLFPLC